MKPGAVSRHLVEGMGWSPWTIAKSVGVLRRWVAIKSRDCGGPHSAAQSLFLVTHCKHLSFMVMLSQVFRTWHWLCYFICDFCKRSMEPVLFV